MFNCDDDCAVTLHSAPLHPTRGAIGVFWACALAAALLAFPEPLHGSAAQEVAIIADMQSRVFVYRLPDQEVMVWDVDASCVRSRFRLPQPLRDNDLSEFIDVVPTSDRHLFALFNWDSAVLFNTVKGEVRPSPLRGMVQSHWHEKEETFVFLEQAKPGQRSWLLKVDVVTGEVRQRWEFASKNFNAVFKGWAAIRYHRNGLVFAVGGQGDGKAILWDLASGKEIWRAPIQYPSFVARFSPDGTLLLVRNDAQAEIRSVTNGELLARSTDGKILNILDGEFSPCGKYVLLCGNLGRIALWEWKQNVVNWTYTIPGKRTNWEGSERFPYCGLYSSDGQRVVVAGSDLAIYEIEARSGTLMEKREMRLLGDASQFKVRCCANSRQ